MKNLIIVFIILFLVACGGGETSNEKIKKKEKVGAIASIREASGICYVDKSDTLFVVGDNGFVYEIDRNGKELNKKDFEDFEHNNFEAIAYNAKEDLLYVALEGADNLLVLDRELKYIDEINIDRKDSEDRKILEKGGNGLEGISILNGTIYVSNQSSSFLPESDPSVVVRLGLNSDDATLQEVISHGYENISGLSFENNILYMVSDTDNLLIKYDIQNKEVISDKSIKDFDSTLKDISLEGVTFDNDGYIYFAIDDKKNGRILKYKI